MINISSMKRHKKNLPQKGFTLVELLVTISVLGLALTGIAALFYSIQYTQQQTRYVDAATRAAQRQVEVLRSNRANSLQPGQTIDFTADLPTTLPNNKSGTVTVSEPASGVKRVDVKVAYTTKGRTQNVTLSSLIGVVGIGQ